MMNSDHKTVLFDGKADQPRRTAGRGPGRPTQAQIERRNEELLNRALDLFLERGFEGTTIEAITLSIGMSPRTVYARYRDKTALFKAALQQAIDNWAVPIERLQAVEEADLEATLLKIARILVANLRSPAGMRILRVAYAESFRMPEIGAYLWEQTTPMTMMYLADMFRRRLRPGVEVIVDSQEAAMAFLVLAVEGSFQKMVWGNTPDDELDRQLVYHTRLFLNGAKSKLL
jgi:AcrR family transcriptional regulator